MVDNTKDAEEEKDLRWAVGAFVIVFICIVGCLVWQYDSRFERVEQLIRSNNTDINSNIRNKVSATAFEDLCRRVELTETKQAVGGPCQGGSREMSQAAMDRRIDSMERNFNRVLSQIRALREDLEIYFQRDLKQKRLHTAGASDS